MAANNTYLGQLDDLVLKAPDGTEIKFQDLDANSRKQVIAYLKGEDKACKKAERSAKFNGGGGAFVGSPVFWTLIIAGTVIGTVALTIGTVAVVRAITADRSMDAGGCSDADGLASAAAYRSQLGFH